ncbi:MAG TPA: hypothetical protein VFI29_04380 [Hanamia sp.]|nr:hypothetical protein [Hanamia sp.]
MKKNSIIIFKNFVSTLIILIAIIIIYLFQGCNRKHDVANSIRYSRTQQRLYDLIDRYDSEYSFLKSQPQKDSLEHEYLLKIDSFLKDSLADYIDSILVTVDTVTDENFLVTTQFHSRQIEFKYGLRFFKGMDSKYDSIYNFYMSLKPKETILINFIRMGNLELGPPGDTNSLNPILRIFALPEPTKAQLEGKEK